jgi:hypothetical protein
MATRRTCLRLGAAAALAAARPLRAAQDNGGLARVRQRGSLLVGLYQDMPPFHVQAEGRSQGIDVELAGALAQQLGVGLSLLPFQADENVEGDLRNMVWRGHYLGWGPADVLLHVPVERPLMAANPKVRILAPYYRETVAIALDRSRFPKPLDGLLALKGLPVGVAGQSLAGWLLLGAEDGALREQLLTRWPDGVAAAQALRNGELVAAAGLASELESVLSNDTRFAIQPLPMPRAPRDGWAVGCAVKAESTELALALQQAMQTLNGSQALRGIFSQRGVRWQL